MSTVPINRQRQTPLPADIAQKLPSNPDAERSVLGAVLMDNAALLKAFNILSTVDFFFPQNSLIYRTMLVLHEDQRPIEALTILDELEKSNEVEAAGGEPYLASLMDGMPRISNVEYYANIVKEKSRRRALIHLTHKIQCNAFASAEDTDSLLQTAEASFKEMVQVSDENPAVVVGFQSMIGRECKPIEYAIEPLLSRRGTGELYGWRGTGKSFISTDMAVQIAIGSDCLWGGHRGAGGHWPVSRPFRQLYVYGEMDESQIQERIREIARMYGAKVPTDEQLGLMCMDFQKGWRPKLSSARDRKYIEDKLIGDGYEGIWFDNLSTLWPASQDAEGERDAILADWYTDLNQRGIWVIWLHHAGKSGLQRGGSEKEDMLSFVIRLRRPSNYKPEEQLRVEVELEKTRHKCNQPRMLMPFEIQLTKDAFGKLCWVTRPALAAQRAAAFEMFKNEVPRMIVGQEVGVSKATAYRWYKDFKENSNPDFHLTHED